jgi:hypothetical protein
VVDGIRNALSWLGKCKRHRPDTLCIWYFSSPPRRILKPGLS